MILKSLVLIGACAALAAEVRVDGPEALRAALAGLRDGAVLRLAPGEYPGGWRVEGVARLVIEAADPARPPHFRGGAHAWHFSRCEGLVVRDLRISGQSGNGLNVDDGGRRESPVGGVRLERLEVSDVGPVGNHDGIKCSGLKDLTLSGCVIRGWGGQAVDFVGVSRALVTGCVFQGKPGFSATAGVQLKGGSCDIVVEKCRFLEAGQRPLNVGGSTGADYFRPPSAKHEAARIIVRDCEIFGGDCAAAFVGVDGATFERNRVSFPRRWTLRFLRENASEGFALCRDVVIRDNEFLRRRGELRSDFNVGAGVETATVRFSANRWKDEGRPDAPEPAWPPR